MHIVIESDRCLVGKSTPQRCPVNTAQNPVTKELHHCLTYMPGYICTIKGGERIYFSVWSFNASCWFSSPQPPKMLLFFSFSYRLMTLQGFLFIALFLLLSSDVPVLNRGRSCVWTVGVNWVAQAHKTAIFIRSQQGASLSRLCDAVLKPFLINTVSWLALCFASLFSLQSSPLFCVFWAPSSALTPSLWCVYRVP